MGGIKKHLSCEHPGRTLTDEENQKLSQHQDAQTENCKFCKKALKTHRKLVSHMLLEHPLQAKEMGLSADQLKKARKAKSKERKQRSKFKICAICGEAFHLTQTLRRHMETEHGQTDGNDKDNDREHGEKKGGLQIMQLDGKEKERVNTSKQKRKYSLKRKPVTCELCNKVFMRPRMLDNHLVLYHGKEPAASEEQAIGDGVSVERNKEISSAFKGKNCEKCGKVFKFMKSLVKHVSYCKGKKAEDANPRSYHFKVARVNCGVCGKEFARPKFLAYHLRYEHSVDPLEPRVVDESENKEGTEGKSKKGAGESVKKLKCWFCEEIFDASDSVVEHMRNFHGVTSKDTDVSSAAKSSTLTFYKCSFDGCGKKLRGRNILTRHLKYGHSIDPKTIDIDKLVVSEPLKNKDAGKAFVTKSVMVTKRKSAPKKSAAKHDATANASKTPSASKPTAVSAISSLQSLCNSVGESEDRIAHARPLRTAKLRASVNPNPFIAGLEQLTANIREEEAVVRQSGRTRGGIPQTPSLHPSYIVNSQAVAGQPVMDLPSSVPYGYSTSALPSRQRNTRRSTQLATRQSRLAQDVNTSELAPPPPGYSYAFVPVLVPTSEAEVVPSRQEMPRRNNRNSRQRYLETELVHDQERAEERGQQTVKSNSSRKRKPRKITKVSKVKKEMKDKRSSCMFSSRSSEEDSDVDNELELIITLTDRETEHLDRTESRKDQDRNGEDNCQRSNTPQLDTDNAKDSQTKSITTVKISPIKKEEPEV